MDDIVQIGSLIGEPEVSIGSLISNPFTAGAALAGKAYRAAVRSPLNPMNWNAPDYTHLGSFNTAYANAKRNGDTEFLWNGDRYNVGYDGSVEQEVKQYHPEANMLYKETPANYPVMAVTHLLGMGKYPHAASKNMATGKTINYPYDPKETKFYSDKDDKFYAVQAPPDVLSVHDKRAARMPKYNHEYDAKMNNCSDAVASGFCLPHSEPYTTPASIPDKLKAKYPTYPLGAKYMESDMIDAIRYSSEAMPEEFDARDRDVLRSVISNPSFLSKPEYKNMVYEIQRMLLNSGYVLPKSTRADNSIDGTWGPETQNALTDYLNQFISR